MSNLIYIKPPGSDNSAAGFESPLAMIKECHRRIESQCQTLKRMVPHLKIHGSDVAAIQAANAVMRYFELAAPLHHADEERDLFPAMIESMAGSDAVCLHIIINDLLAEHEEIDQVWRSLNTTLRIIASGQSIMLDETTVDIFETLHVRHIACEEQEVLPMAERLLSDRTLAEIGRSMQARRLIH